MTQLLELAAVARDMVVSPGMVLSDASDEPAILHVIAGELLLERGGTEPLVAGPGATVGMCETLAGEPFNCRVVARGEGLVVRLDRTALFDVAADHVGVLQGLFSALLQADDHDAPATPVRVVS